MTTPQRREGTQRAGFAGCVIGDVYDRHRRFRLQMVISTVSHAATDLGR
jgi:hypothetical protein